MTRALGARDDEHAEASLQHRGAALDGGEPRHRSLHGGRARRGHRLLLRAHGDGEAPGHAGGAGPRLRGGADRMSATLRYLSYVRRGMARTMGELADRSGLPTTAVATVDLEVSAAGDPIPRSLARAGPRLGPRALARRGRARGPARGQPSTPRRTSSRTSSCGPPSCRGCSRPPRPAQRPADALARARRGRGPRGRDARPGPAAPSC